jgi:hypothetical protein
VHQCDWIVFAAENVVQDHQAAGSADAAQHLMRRYEKNLQFRYGTSGPADRGLLVRLMPTGARADWTPLRFSPRN